MDYCSRCLYPRNAKPYIIFDDESVCSGCRVAEKYALVDWEARTKRLGELLAQYKAIAKERHNHYDCIIPVSGGKDSHFQTHIIKNVYGMNPLLVSYNHVFNSPLGNRNLANLIRKLGCDNVRFTSSPEAVRKLSRHMLKKCGDLTWHYHAGILTLPLQMAVKFNIPLIVWGENDFSKLVGTFNPDDMVEFSRKHRKDFGLRGLEATDALGEDGIAWQDIAPFVYPDDDDIERVGVRGIYLSNFVKWDEKSQAELMMDLYDFGVARSPRDRTFNLYAKLEDLHANGTHDYLKYLKFGYGRATDDASTLVRAGMITREEGIALVRRHDHVRPRDLDVWLRYVNMTEEEFMGHVNPLRDPDIWEQGPDGEWRPLDSVANHVRDPFVEKARLPLSRREERVYREGRYPVDDPRWLLDYDGYVI